MDTGSRHVVVMGISGSGKTTIATQLTETLGWVFAEADDFHPPANIEKMTAGTALTDEDRWPWLESMRTWLTEQAQAGRSTVVTCSALRRSYRDVLTQAEGRVDFVHLLGDTDLILERMKTRSGHFMPESLLPSQISTLEPLGPDEQGVMIENTGTPHDVVSRVIDQLGLRAG
ncbi:Thermoresistant gluconokinase [Arthrobacter agilis]|uniref:gluconokinase n=1 Tax=Arthrobacter agilis TaxID=37921 RepID=UPI000B586A1F|nr:gluconokinase [Arthrobacter agilis]OUM42326.1 gluconate kinase [Arthrobacter agilis]VDR30785.1 Thermoresistant gluconokinase [Arthrobacter agilis]